jgi:hypothetical protein
MSAVGASIFKTSYTEMVISFFKAIRVFSLDKIGHKKFIDICVLFKKYR